MVVKLCNVIRLLYSDGLQGEGSFVTTKIHLLLTSQVNLLQPPRLITSVECLNTEVVKIGLTS